MLGLSSEVYSFPSISRYATIIARERLPATTSLIEPRCESKARGGKLAARFLVSSIVSRSGIDSRIFITKPDRESFLERVREGSIALHHPITIIASCDQYAVCVDIGHFSFSIADRRAIIGAAAVRSSKRSLSFSAREEMARSRPAARDLRTTFLR